jgi:DNA-binding FadR family transcriptional regulator
MVTVEWTDSLGTVTKYTLAEQVVTILKRFILTENLQAGDQLPSERQLVDALGVSQRVIREALSIIAGEGLVEKKHGLGTFVQPFDRQRLLTEQGTLPVHFPDAADLHEARCAIECGAAQLAAARATAQDIAELEACIQGMQRSDETGSSVVADDVCFHLTLLKATHNETLQGLSHLITESIRLHDIWTNPGGLHRKTQDIAHILRAHRAIVAAIRDREPLQASQAMYDHLTWRYRGTAPKG